MKRAKAIEPATQKKRRHDDKDQDPSAKSDQRMKKKETVFDAADTNLPLDQGDNMGIADEQPNDETAPKTDKSTWSKKPPRPPTLDPKWNKGKSDMLLLLLQNKLFNLKGDVIVDLAVALRMYTQRIVFQRRVKDVQLSVESYQKKLNISKPQTRSVDISFKEPYTTQSHPQGVIYEDKQKVRD
nr:hypothetical protein [Tanacetum cinerariifolium]